MRGPGIATSVRAMAVSRPPRWQRPSRSCVLIVNANARKFVATRSLLLDVDRLVEGRAQLVVTHSRAELDEAARAATDAEVVVLCGGDGSWGAGVTAFARARKRDARPLPIFALAPGGTVGTVANGLGVAPGGATFAGIARVVHAALSPNRATIDAATLAITANGSTRLGFIFGTGLVAKFFRLYDPRGADKEGPSSGAGNAAAARIVARVFAESFFGGPFARQVLDPLRCDVSVEEGVDEDGVSRRLPWSASSLVVAATVRDLGLGMKVTHRGGEDPTRPHFVVSGLAPRALGPRMTRVLRGVPIGAPPEPHFDGLARSVAISFPDEAGPFVVDGDLHEAPEIRVTAGPSIRVLRLGA